MKTRALYFFILMTLFLSACSGQSTPASTPIPPATELPPTIPSTIEAPSPTAAPPATATLSPTNEPGCTDKAIFVSDVTVPDGTVYNTGEVYTKTWRISNSGSCAWNSDYSIVYSSGERSGAPDSAPLAFTAAGASLDISLNLTAPAKKGTTNTFFELHNPAGKQIPVDNGYYLYVSIYINGSAAAASSMPGGTTQPEVTASAGVLGGACAYTTDPAKVAEVIAAINNYRTQNGRPALPVNPLLTKAAEAHAADMACNNLFSHTGTDGSSPTTRVAAAGYATSSVTENVYGSYPPLNGQGVVAWWATDQIDPRHNENLMTTKYKEIGVAYAFYNNYGYYVVDFAVP